MPEPGNLKRRVSAKRSRERFKSDSPAWPAPATDTGNIKMFYAGDDHAVAVVKATALFIPAVFVRIPAFAGKSGLSERSVWHIIAKDPAQVRAVTPTAQSCHPATTNHDRLLVM